MKITLYTVHRVSVCSYISFYLEYLNILTTDNMCENSLIYNALDTDAAFQVVSVFDDFLMILMNWLSYDNGGKICQ